jgi:glycosyltransferase involved in cell wall biosynthesis
VLLVGDGQTRALIERQVQALGLAGRVVFTGRVEYERVPQFLAVCDACTAHYDPSRHVELRRQGMFFDPLKVFEYLAMGKPTVTLDTPNMRGLFEDERHALLVPPGDRARYGEALLRLMREPALRQRLAEQGRAWVEERYSWRAHAAQLTQLFEELLDDGAARAAGH